MAPLPGRTLKTSPELKEKQGLDLPLAEAAKNAELLKLWGLQVNISFLVEISIGVSVPSPLLMLLVSDNDLFANNSLLMLSLLLCVIYVFKLACAVSVFESVLTRCY